MSLLLLYNPGTAATVGFRSKEAAAILTAEPEEIIVPLPAATVVFTAERVLVGTFSESLDVDTAYRNNFGSSRIQSEVADVYGAYRANYGFGSRLSEVMTVSESRLYTSGLWAWLKDIIHPAESIRGQASAVATITENLRVNELVEGGPGNIKKEISDLEINELQRSFGGIYDTVSEIIDHTQTHSHNYGLYDVASEEIHIGEYVKTFSGEAIVAIIQETIRITDYYFQKLEVILDAPREAAIGAVTKGIDFLIEFTGRTGRMTFDKIGDIRNNIFFSLVLKRGAFFRNRLFGSRLHLLHRAKATPKTERLARLYAIEALLWLIDAGKAKKISVDTEFGGNNRLNLFVTVTRTNNTINTFQTFIEVV